MRSDKESIDKTHTHTHTHTPQIEKREREQLLTLFVKIAFQDSA